MKYILQFFYLVLQFTWGAIQNVLGFLLFLKNIRCEHAYYHGAILTFHEGDWDGVSTASAARSTKKPCPCMSTAIPFSR